MLVVLLGCRVQTACRAGDSTGPQIRASMLIGGTGPVESSVLGGIMDKYCRRWYWGMTIRHF
jgi:hypothetical protein